MPKAKPKSLSHGRPPSVTSTRTPTNLSSHQTRTTIRTHHQLQKSLSHALTTHNTSLAASLTRQIQQRGGLESYQAASLQGQSAQRGGDTSKALLGFLDAVGMGEWRREAEGRKWRMLDVGALSADTAAERCRCFEITRIDLHSQGVAILEQDFMQRPLPGRDDGARFDVVCLSLVLNYVPDARGRGEMLKRVCEFLVGPRRHDDGDTIGLEDGNNAPSGTDNDRNIPFPGLFLVLPAPCVTNSRYLDQDSLNKIMESLGFKLIEMKLSAKLAYCFFQWHGPRAEKITFAKKEIVSGKTRNNFSIVVT